MKSSHRTWLAVPPEEKDEAINAHPPLANGRKALVWEKELKLWYARPGVELSKLDRWLPRPQTLSMDATDPVTEFAQVLENAGLVLKGSPIMDGSLQRVPTKQDKKGAQSGAYKAFLDGKPAGWYRDYRSANVPAEKWVFSGGDNIDPLARLHLRAHAQQTREDATRKLEQQYSRQAGYAANYVSKLPQATSNEYLIRKGVQAAPGVRLNNQNELVIPFSNVEGQIRSYQRIPVTGGKDARLLKDSEKTGNWFTFGVPANGQAILLAEGYATAASLHEASGLPVLMTVDAGNMIAVGQNAHKRWPDSQLIFCADNDHSLVDSKGEPSNKGILSATKAADLTNGILIAPAFTAADQQQGFTDFNDLDMNRGRNIFRNIVNVQLLAIGIRTPFSDEPQIKNAIMMGGVVLTPEEENTMATTVNHDHPEDPALNASQASLSNDAFPPLPDNVESASAANIASAMKEAIVQEFFSALSDDTPSPTSNVTASEVVAPNQTSAVVSTPVMPEIVATGTEEQPVISNDGTQPNAESTQLDIDAAPQPATSETVSSVDSSPVLPGDSIPDTTEQATTIDHSNPLGDAPGTPSADAVQQSVISDSVPVASNVIDVNTLNNLTASNEQQTVAAPTETLESPKAQTEFVLTSPDAALALSGVIGAASASKRPAVEQPSAEETRDSVTPPPTATKNATAPEAPADSAEIATAEADSIVYGPRRPDAPHHENIEQILKELKWESQSDNTVLYKVDDKDAFRDLGNRIEMCDGASQNDRNILAALAVATKFYGGVIELTGSSEFKDKSMRLIIEYDLDVRMKIPAQRAQLDALRKELASAHDTVVTHQPTPNLNRSTLDQTAPQTSNQAQSQQQVPVTEIPTGPQPRVPQVPAMPSAPPVPPSMPTLPVPSASTSDNQTGADTNRTVSQDAIQVEAQPTEHAPSSLAPGQSVTAVLMDFGNAKYENGEKQGSSFYVRLQNRGGDHVYWGQDLRELTANRKIGDVVTLTLNSREVWQNPGDKQERVKNNWSMVKTSTGIAVPHTQPEQGQQLQSFSVDTFGQFTKQIREAWPDYLSDLKLPPRFEDRLFYLSSDRHPVLEPQNTPVSPPPEQKPTDIIPIMASLDSQTNKMDLLLVQSAGEHLQGVVRLNGTLYPALASPTADNQQLVISAVTDTGLRYAGYGQAVNFEPDGTTRASPQLMSFQLQGREEDDPLHARLYSPEKQPDEIFHKLGFDQTWRQWDDVPKPEGRQEKVLQQDRSHSPGR